MGSSREWKWNDTTSVAEPILDVEPGNLTEIAKVGREERRLIGQGDRRDTRIPRPDLPYQVGSEVAHHAGGGLVEGQDATLPERVKIQEPAELLERSNLLVRPGTNRVDPPEAFANLLK